MTDRECVHEVVVRVLNAMTGHSVVATAAALDHSREDTKATTEAGHDSHTMSEGEDSGLCSPL